jgi:outer membrane protein OmpA-like peptidoglycan-associated protein
MNSKPIVLAVFAVWSLVCWRWYVCGIMDACDPAPSTENAVAVDPLPNPAIEPEETAVVPQPTASDPSKSTVAPIETNPAPTKVSPSNMDEVQMERVDDRMVIHFPYKSSRKEDNAAIDAYLADLARQLASTGQKVTITGHTDFVGEPADNYQFGLRRAQGIRDILVKKGVSKSQIQCKSFGDRKPVATNDTPYGRYLNRRVEIRVHK